MLKIFERLFVPPFLRRLDTYLLEQYPVVWRTRVHYVLFYAVSGAVLLFAAGYFAHISAVDLQVDPIKPIEMWEDSQFRWAFMALFPFLVFWAITQYKASYPFYKPKETLLTSCLYTFCFWVLLGITAPAYRMGTIYHTAHWMDHTDETGKTDVERFDSSGIYPYGFVLLASDSVYKPQQDSFYQSREAILKKIWATEDTLLQYRYNNDTTFWFSFIRSDLSDLSYLSYRSDLSYRSYLSYRSDLSYRSYLSYRSDLSYLSDRSDRSYRSKYMEIRKSKYQQIQMSIPNQYGFLMGEDTIPKTSMVFRPQLPNSVEDAVRSVKHAQQYLNEGIFWRYLYWLRYIVLFCSIIFFFVAFVPLRYVAIGLMAVFLAWTMLNMEFVGLEKMIDDDSSKSYRINVAAYLCLPAIGVLILVACALRKQQLPTWVSFSCALIFIGAFLTILPLTGIAEQFTNNEVGLPYDHAFFGVQILGVVAAFLITYVQALPKKS